MSYLNFEKEKKKQEEKIKRNSSEIKEHMGEEFKNTTINPATQPVDDVKISLINFYIKVTIHWRV